jgi:hypothetical protein
MASDDKVKVGDELWVVSRYSHPGSGTVTKVGHKWFTAGYSEFSLTPERDGSFISKPSKDGTGSSYYAWRSKEAYETALRLRRRRDQLTNAIRDTVMRRHDHVPLEQLEAAAKALGIEVPE